MIKRIGELAGEMERSGVYTQNEAATYAALMIAMNETTDPQVIKILGAQLAAVSAKISPDQWVIDLIISGELHRIAEVLSGDIDRNKLN